MEVEKVRVLLAVLEEGSLSGAAEALGYTPSGLSRSIAALEQETGFPLLHREHRGVRPTAACRELLPAMWQLLSAQRQYRQQADALRGLEQGRLAIGCAYSSFLPELARTLAVFSAVHPGIRAELSEGSSSEISAAIREGRVDLAIISRREGDFDWMPLRQDQLVAVLPSRHPLAGCAAYPVEHFAADDFIEILPQKETDNSRLFDRLSLRPRTRFSCGDTLSALSMVEVGLGVTLVNALLLENWPGRAAVLPLDPPQPVEIGVAVLSRAAASPAAREFLHLLSGEPRGATAG